jgi:hypothetical protein
MTLVGVEEALTLWCAEDDNATSKERDATTCRKTAAITIDKYAAATRRHHFMVFMYTHT